MHIAADEEAAVVSDGIAAKNLIQSHRAVVVGRGDGNAFVGLKFSIVVKWRVGEGADIRTSREDE